MKKINLIDTHCHINMMVKKTFDTIMSPSEVRAAEAIIDEAQKNNVNTLIQVGTSIPESANCITLAQQYPHIYAVVGIHPNDCTDTWYTDFKTIVSWVKQKKHNNIVGIGECGIDKHYPNFNVTRQNDAFRAHIELALEYDLALVVHSRDAHDETLAILDEYKHNLQRGVIHCFSYDQAFADHVQQYNFVLGIGGTITYPRNTELRSLVQTIDMHRIVLETDAPFLPVQERRGTQNHPLYIKTIAAYIAELRNETVEYIAEQTTLNAQRLFNL